MLLIGLLQATEFDGAEVYRDNCTRCHAARSPSELDAERWPAVIFHMRTRAGLTAAEARALELFLVPPPSVSPPAVLANTTVAAKCVRCHDAERIQDAVTAGRSADEWQVTFTRMALYGAALTTDERTELARWLTGAR